MNDSTTQLAELKALVAKFRDERAWGKHHSPKNLAVSIAIEAAELMELFQWDEYTKKNQNDIQNELADILVYCLMFADTLNIDVASAVQEKIKRAEIKYPPEVFNADNDSPDDYNASKKLYREK